MRFLFQCLFVLFPGYGYYFRMVYSVPVVALTESQLTTLTSPVEKGSQAERLIAVGYVFTPISNFLLKTLSRIALIGVLGASGACKENFFL